MDITAKVRTDNSNFKYQSYIITIPKALINVYEIKQGDMLTVDMKGKLSKNGVYTVFKNE